MSARDTEKMDLRIGANIRKARRQRRLSLAQLAELLGLNRQQVYKYEAGLNRVPASRLFQIADALRHPIEAFRQGFENDLGKKKSAVIVNTRPCDIIYEV